MIWRLLIEEYGPEIIYIKGFNNVSSDEISRLGLSGLPTKHYPTTFEELFVTDSILAGRYGMGATDQEMMPLRNVCY